MPSRRQLRNARRKKQTRRTMHGGKLIGQGTYGCGFIPALRCHDEAIPVTDTLSKVIRYDHAETEFKLSNEVYKVDPDMVYSIYPTKMCSMHPDDVIRHQHELTTECGAIKRLIQQKPNASIPAHFSILQSPAASYDLHTFIYQVANTNPTLWAHFINYYGHLLEGLGVYHFNSLYHMDIKPPNVVVGHKGHAPDYFKFIDFGLMVNKSTLAAKSAKEVLAFYKPDYEIFPFELKFAYMTAAERNAISDATLDAMIAKKFANTRTPFDIVIQYSAGAMRKIFKSMDIMDAANDARVYLEKADVYMMGYMLYETLFVMFNAVMEMGRMKIVNVEKHQYHITSYDAVLSTIHVELVNAYHHMVQPLSDLVIQMMHIDPSRRLTAGQALTVYNKIVIDAQGGLDAILMRYAHRIREIADVKTASAANNLPDGLPM